MDLNKLFNSGYQVKSEDVCDSYTMIAYKMNLLHYRILTTRSLIVPEKLVRSKDIADYGYDFIAEQGKCLGIFNIVNGVADYVILRSLKEKKFLTVGGLRSIPYGIGYWKDFKYGDLVVVVEGLKDRDALSIIYPYVIAAQSAGLSLLSKMIVKTITNKIMLLYDNDDAGSKAIVRDTRWFRNNGVQVIQGLHPTGTKDCGEIADSMYNGDYYHEEFLKNYYNNQILSYL